MKKLITKPIVTPYQQFSLVGASSFLFFKGIRVVIWYIKYYSGAEVSGEPYQPSDALGLLMFIASFIVCIIAISKEGVLFKNNEMYRSLFVFGKPYGFKKVDLKNFIDLSIISSQVNHKYAYGATLNPDETYTTKMYQIVALNNNHSRKIPIASFGEIEYAKQIAQEIADITGLKLNIYAPPISNKTKQLRARRRR